MKELEIIIGNKLGISRSNRKDGYIMWKELTIKEAKEATNKLIKEMTDEECLKIMEEFESDSKKIMEPNRVPSPYGIALKKMIIKYKEMCDYEK